MTTSAFNDTNLSGLRADYETAQTFISTKFDSTGQMLGNDMGGSTYEVGESSPSTPGM